MFIYKKKVQVQNIKNTGNFVKHVNKEKIMLDDKWNRLANYIGIMIFTQQNTFYYSIKYM